MKQFFTHFAVGFLIGGVLGFVGTVVTIPWVEIKTVSKPKPVVYSERLVPGDNF